MGDIPEKGRSWSVKIYQGPAIGGPLNGCCITSTAGPVVTGDVVFHADFSAHKDFSVEYEWDPALRGFVFKYKTVSEGKAAIERECE